MKKQLFACVAALSLATIVSLPLTSLYAQSSGTIKATIPFDFIVGSQQFSAGEYALDSKTSPSALVVRDEKYHGRAIVLVGAAESPKVSEQTKLVFNRYGDQYFLSQVWMAGQSRGQQLFPSRMEHEIAKLTPAAQKKTFVATLK